MFPIKIKRNSEDKSIKLKKKRMPHNKKDQKFEDNASIDFDDSIGQAKGYRLFLNYFVYHIRKYYAKPHLDCLGELDDPFKIPVGPQQNISNSSLQKIVEKNIQKIVKDNLNRNLFINRSLAKYVDDYAIAFKIDKIEKVVQNLPEKNHFEKKEKIIRPKSSYVYNNHTKKTPSSQFIHIKENQKGERKSGIIDLFNEFTGQSEDMASYTMMKDSVSKNPHKPASTAFISISKKQDTLLSKGKRKKQLKKQNYDLNNQIRTPVGKRPTTASGTDSTRVQRNSLNRYLAHSIQIEQFGVKSFIDIEKQKLKNKILMTNNKSPSTSMVTSQGYQPKSKCWGSSLKMFAPKTPILPQKNSIHFCPQVQQNKIFFQS